MDAKPAIRVLLIDDSAGARAHLKWLIEATEDLELIAECENNASAITLVEQLKPDVICIDLDRPLTQGLNLIESIMHRKAFPILALLHEDEPEIATAAIQQGALDAVRKPRTNANNSAVFLERIRLISGVSVVTRFKHKKRLDMTAGQYNLPFKHVVAIVCSTGGPQALSYVLDQLPASFAAPILISQHMSDGFAEGMVRWLASVSRLPIKLAEHGEQIRAQQVYLSPSERHMTLDAEFRICLLERSTEDIYRPCCNYLLESVAQHCADRTIALIMTGMGRDGVRGMRQVKDAGGITLAQDEASSIIFGMNQEAIRQQSIDEVIALDRLPKRLQQLVMGSG